MSRDTLILSILGLLLGPVINRLSTAIPEWLGQINDDARQVRRWPGWEGIISIECGLILALMPLLIADPSSPVLNLRTVFCWALVLLALINARSMRLPNLITLPLLAVGVLVSIAGFGAPIRASLLGAALGYAWLWVLNQVSVVMTGSESLRQGDMTLLAAIGAWLGFTALPFIMVSASILEIGWRAVRRSHRHKPVSFGPMLCIATIGLSGLL